MGTRDDTPASLWDSDETLGCGLSRRSDSQSTYHLNYLCRNHRPPPRHLAAKAARFRPAIPIRYQITMPAIPGSIEGPLDAEGELNADSSLINDTHGGLDLGTGGSSLVRLVLFVIVVIGTNWRLQTAQTA